MLMTCLLKLLHSSANTGRKLPSFTFSQILPPRTFSQFFFSFFSSSSFVHSFDHSHTTHFFHYHASMSFSNGANVFCFLSSLPLLPPATTAVFVSYLSSLYILTNTVSRVRACLSIWSERFYGSQKEDETGPLSKLFLDVLLVFSSLVAQCENLP